MTDSSHVECPGYTTQRIRAALEDAARGGAEFVAARADVDRTILRSMVGLSLLERVAYASSFVTALSRFHPDDVSKR